MIIYIYIILGVVYDIFFLFILVSSGSLEFVGVWMGCQSKQQLYMENKCLFSCNICMSLAQLNTHNNN